MARFSAAVTAASLAFVLVGCSSPATSTGADGAGSTAGAGAPAAGGSIDCAYFKSGDGQAYQVRVQVMAQLTSQDAVNLVKDGTLAYNPDAMDATLHQLKKLAGHDPEGLGDPGPDVDFYMKANDKVRAILAIDGDVPQSMFDDLSSFEGDPGSFIMHMGTINAALASECN